MKITKEDIIGAVARGWCDKENSGKIVDVTLAKAITNEITVLLDIKPKLPGKWDFRFTSTHEDALQKFNDLIDYLKEVEDNARNN